MSAPKRLVRLTLMLLEFERDDDRNLGRDRMRWARWHRVIRRKAETGRGRIVNRPTPSKEKT